MGKGSRKRRDRDREPNRGRRELGRVMAPDAPKPAKGTPQWGQRLVQAIKDGHVLVTQALSTVMDAETGLGALDALGDPQREGEPDEQYQQRRQLWRTVAEMNLQLADYSPDVADQIRRIRPSDALDVVTAILDVAQYWCRTSGYTAPATAIQPLMETTLDGLMPPQWRQRGQDALDAAISPGLDDGLVDVERLRLRILGSAALDLPFEALYLACAYVAALYQVPECVPNPRDAALEFGEIAFAVQMGDPRAMDRFTAR